MTAASINIQDLGKAYDGQVIFEKLNFEVAAGCALTIVGPSGCGKSTLLHILAGLEDDFQGRVEISPAQADKALMLQHYGLFPWKNARDNIELPLRLKGESKADRGLKTTGMLRELKLSDCQNLYPGQLSGGQQQRLALGRALIAKPDLLLLDEPFSSLDAISRENLQNLLAELWRKYALTYVLTTHSIEEAVFLGQRILVMGGAPTGLIADFNNSTFGRDEARQQDDYFSLVKKVRLSLASSSLRPDR